MRVEIPLSQFFRVRWLLTGAVMHRAVLSGLIEKLDAAGRDGDHVVLDVTEEERQAAVAEIAGCGTPSAKLCLLFKEPAEDVPVYTLPEGTPTRLVNIPSDDWRQAITAFAAERPDDAVFSHVRDVLAAALPNDDGSFSVRLPEDQCDYFYPAMSGRRIGGKSGSMAAMFFMSRPEPTDDHRWSL